MIDKKKLKKAFSEVFRDSGFLHQGQSWYLDSTEATVVVNLQKSDYEDKYYLNFGVWLKKLGITSFPKENKCHIQARLSSLFHDAADVFERGCSLSEGSEETLEELITFIRLECIPFFRSCLNEINLRAFLMEGRFANALVMKFARDFLLSSS